MHPSEIKAALDSMTILVDTREQDNQRMRARLEAMGVPWERQKLNFGDYSVKCDALSLAGQVAVERKMSLDEMAQCFTHDRARFTREFERAKGAGAKTYLLIENASWELAYAGRYRSKVKPSALIASMAAWLARYDCQLIMCSERTSGKLIREILFRELKERLEAMPDAD